MKKKRISETLNHLNHTITEEAITYKAANSSAKAYLIKIVAAAACLVLITTAAFVFFQQQKGDKNTVYIGGIKREYNGLTVTKENTAKVWPWKYLDVANQYPNINFNGKEYQLHASNINKSHIGESLGVVEAFGYDETDDHKEYRKSFEIFSVKSIKTDFFIAAYMENRYVIFKDNTYLSAPDTLGDFINDFNLKNNIELKHFEKYTNYKSGEKSGYYSTNDNNAIWDELIKCADVPSLKEDVDLWLKGEREFISFTITSDALGVYKHVMYITSDGYLSTNIFGPGYVYFIGKDAADNIVKCATENAIEVEPEPYNSSVVGTVTEIQKDYILIDDSILCNNAKDGMTFKILIDEKRLKGYVEVESLKKGDLVSVSFSGEVDTDNDNLIRVAHEISQVKLIKDNKTVVLY